MQPTLRQIVDDYLHQFADESQRLAPLLEQLDRHYPGDAHNHPCSRHTLPGHVSASGMVVANGNLLMVLHPYLHVWLQPGGHLEPDEALLHAAQREVREETAVATEPHRWQLRHRIPVDIDIHRIAANPMKNEPEHWHFDFRYWLTVRSVVDPEPDLDPDSGPARRFDRLPIRWSRISDLAAMDAKISPGLARILDKLGRL